MTPVIIAHGGAWHWDDQLDEPKRQAVKEAARIGQSVLNESGTALDAVEQTVIALENHPVLDAGTGGYLNASGQVQLDAMIADGTTLSFGAVAGVTRLHNPVSVARAIMEQTAHHFFVGTGAEAMAASLGFDLIDNAVLVTPAMRVFAAQHEQASGHDTVGAVAIDVNGHCAAATSTSGSANKPEGRVGDSPLFGSGGYAENGVGAIGATGLGEQIMRLLLSRQAADLIRQGCSAQEAAAQAMAIAARRFDTPRCGLIIVDHNGRVGMAHTTPKMAVAWCHDKGPVQSRVRLTND
ncbi:MAG: isoaspartyl peptidase/L-asparaginase [Saprospiraceae bacterium]|nr:isoaspartyl peptidase/L-asparaginase [Saprospiraceae bacterium]